MRAMKTTNPAPTDLPGEPASLWLKTAPTPQRPCIEGHLDVDIAVVGGGITGVTAALLAKEAGATVALLEAGRIAGGVTGYTTAKVTSLHGLTYARLIARFGEEGARAYGEANEAGLERIARFVSELEIDCDFERRANYTYALSPSERSNIEDEVTAARQLGLPASFAETVDLPFSISGAVRFSNQAQFHPRRYLLALADRIPGGGSHVFEHSRVHSIDDGNPCVIRTDSGAVKADQVIVATHMPMLDRGLYFARVHPERSYVLAARLRGQLPKAMYLSTEKPAHSIRAHPVEDGEALIVGGESHKTGQSDTSERYRALARWALETFEIERFEYRWATQDNMPADGMPLIGRLWPFSNRLYTATGFRKWGLALGTAAAMMLTDAIGGRDNRWAPSFDPMRLKLRASAGELAKENADVALRFFGDRLKRSSSAGLARGEGRLVRDGLGQAAVYRDEEGRLHELSARCTHLGCIVSWNSAERTWDCPCHGSRFDHRGRVIQGPAVEPLKPKR
jgi:glycine/D-amino acid oxidase-like deaminating enzyme/nitrite reductase/ring-hydroxylating ferredoxin subunit